MSTVVVQAYGAGSVVIQPYDAGTIIATQSGVTLPVWLTHDFDYSDGGYIDGGPIDSTTDSVSGMVASSTLTARPTYRADYLSTGVAAAQFDGVNDFQETATNIDLTAGYTYSGLVHITTLRNFVLFFDVGSTAQLYTVSTGLMAYVNRPAPSSVMTSTVGDLDDGEWAFVTVVDDGTPTLNLTLYVNRVLAAGPATIRKANFAAPLTIGWNRNVIFQGKMFGAIAGSYFGPPSTPTQRTELWDYMAEKHGVAL